MVTIEEYNNKPDNVDNILELSNYYSNIGLHDLSLLFCEQGLSLSTTDEQKHSFLERASISGFYSKLSSRFKFGKEACEKLSMDRNVSWHTRNLARQNGTFYSSSATCLMPSTELLPINFIPVNGYKSTNPSISTHNGNIWMIQRTVNYLIRPDGSYDMQGDTAIRTVNYMIKLSSDLRTILSFQEILPPIDMPAPLYDMVVGFEDSRLFWWNNEPWCTSTVRELNTEGYCEIVIAKINGVGTAECRLSDYRVIRPKFCDKQHEKNWMPMVVDNHLFFMYSSDPVRIINEQGDLILTFPSHVASDNFRGGGSIVKFDGGWLGLIHESHGMNNSKRRYMHRFVWYNSTGRLSRYSEAFYIKQLGIEFSPGFAIHPNNKQAIISFGVEDRESCLAVINLNEIRQILIPAGEFSNKFSNDAQTINWIIKQTNIALTDTQVIEHSKLILEKSNLPLHIDSPKNWDNLLAVYYASVLTDQSAPIMDVAATDESAFLPSLKSYGFNNLLSINLDVKSTTVVDGISYQYGDCTQTTFDDNYFGFIAGLSVIEHGVDIDKFLKESSRILQQNGHLIISTDYWIDPIDTGGQMAFGAPVKIFDMNNIFDLIERAKQYGLILMTEPHLNCKDKVVKWLGMEYTFVNLLFVKK